MWYCFDDAKKEYPAPKWQLKAIKDALKAGVTDDEKDKLLPIILDDYFTAFQFNHFKEYVKQTITADPKPTTATKNTTLSSVNTDKATVVIPKPKVRKGPQSDLAIESSDRISLSCVLVDQFHLPVSCRINDNEGNADR